LNLAYGKIKVKRGLFYEEKVSTIPTYVHGGDNVKKGNYRALLLRRVAEKLKKSIRWPQGLPSWNERTESWLSS